MPHILNAVPNKKEKLPLSVTHPELAKEADGWDPEEVTAGSSKKRDWKCRLGHKWSAVTGNRAVNGAGCPVCAGKKVLVGFNDLASQFPALAGQANSWDPSTVTSGSNSVQSWKCNIGHVWNASVKSRTHGTSCPYCSGNKVLPGFNDLATRFQEVAIEADGWDPTLVLAVSGQMKTWKCKFGHLYKMTISNRSYGHGCPFCSGRQVIVGENDLKTLMPSLAAEADGWNTQEVSPGSNRIKKWTCPSGHSWSATVVDRSTGHGCPSCAATGFDPNKPSWLYFLENLEWEMLQIGITNDFSRRFSEHNRNGWEILEIRGPMDGHLTKQLEGSILRMLKAKGADLSNKKIAGKFDGYSESWSKSSFQVESIKELMLLTKEFEEK